MDLRKAVYAAESLGYMEYGQRLGVAPSDRNLLEERRQAVAVRDAYLRMAEAAIALAEYQAFVAFDATVEDELWRAFKEAHKAAKDANQS